MAYIPLDTSRNLFRLLHLNPASSADDAIGCRFTVASLDDDPQYEALSYVWGDVSNTHFVEVDGRLAPVTANLHSMLRHLRLQDRERVLWVDALCINQSDLEERMHQVSRMSSIYGIASQVIVWLGEGWPGTDMAMEFLQKLGEDETLHLDPSLSPSVVVNGLKLDSMELCGHLIRLFDLPWWKRTWTIQEFVLAPKLVFQCSRSSVTRDIMYMARENFWSHRDRCCPRNESDGHSELGLSLESAFEQPARLDFITKSRSHAYSVLTAIATFCKREVTDPRDRIYGMLGLGTGPYANLVRPDYSLTPEQACEAIAIQSVEKTGTLEFLSHLFDHQNTKLPSFIPNWTGTFKWNDIYSLRLGHVRFFSASLDIAAEVNLVSPEMLTTRGVIFDNIAATTPGDLFEYLLQPSSLLELHRLTGFAKSPEEPYCHTSDPRLVAFWHTLCGGMETILRDSNRFGGRLKGSKDLSKWSKWATFVTTPHQRAELWDNELSHVMLDIESATRGQAFFVTEKGYFGLAPQKCRKEDQVVVLLGGGVPYIIRPASHELCADGCYNILGDSYVHGIMDGEVFELLDETEWGLEKIVLV